jgi:hypothetical protein
MREDTLRDDRFEVSVTFDERRGYVASAPELRSPVTRSPWTDCAAASRCCCCPTMSTWCCRRHSRRHELFGADYARAHLPPAIGRRRAEPAKKLMRLEAARCYRAVDWPLRGKQMKFAVVEGKRREAEPGLSGKCQGCGNAMIAKCGQHRVRHWAHRGTRNCNSWWEPETEWHRAWKNHFPEDWQEVDHQSEGGEKHRADVKTESGVVLEFQHSLLRQDEREARETFIRGWSGSLTAEDGR